MPQATFTADTRPLNRGMDDAVRKIRGVKQASDDTGRALKSAGSAFDGTKLEGAALRAVKSVERIGGVTRLTATELQRVGRITDEAMQKFTALGTQAPAAIQKLSRELQAAQKSAGGLSAALGLFAGGIGVGVGLSVFNSISQGLKEIAADGAKLGPIRQGFESMQGGASAAQTTLDRMRASTRGLVDDLALMTAANRGVLLGLTDMGIDMAEVARVATVLGRAVGQDATKSTDDLTVALARQSPMILDNLGIKMSLGDANLAYAASLGKTVDELTEQERSMAFATAAMDAARAKAAELGDQQLTVAENIEQSRVAVSGLVMDFAAMANEATFLITPLQRLAETLQTIRSAGLGSSLRFGISGLVEQAGRAMNTIPGAQFTPVGMAVAANLQNLSRFGATGDDIGNVLGGASSMQSIGRQLAAEATGRDTVTAAVRRQATAGESRTVALRKEREEAERLDAVFQRMLRPAIGVNSLLGTSSIGGIAGARTAGFGNVPGLPGATAPAIGINQFDSVFKAFGVSGGQSVDMAAGVGGAVRVTRDWRVELQGVAQAFAQLAQAAGPSLDGVSRVLGVSLTSANAADQVLQALNQRFEGFSSSTAGRALGGGLAGGVTGLQIGGLFSNQAAGLFAGAAGGAATGGLVGGAVGAGVGAITGGLSGLFGASQNARAQQAQMEQMRQQAIGTFGSLDLLQQSAVRAGFSVESFMSGFQSHDVTTFSQTMNTLNRVMTEQRTRAEALGRALGSVAQQQGILSQQQIAQIRTTDRSGEGVSAIVAFAESQRQQSIAGILRAAAALERMASLSDTEIENLTAGITDREERAAVIEAALRDRAGSVMGNLRQGVQATASAIFVAINDAVASGDRLVDVLADLAPAIGTVRDLFSRSGQTPGAGFAQVESYQRIASGPQTGPALELATGLGQAMAAFSNTGLLSPELFQEMAAGIGAAYKQMENLGQGGLDAARLMQPALQNIWQLIQDNPGLEAQLDDDTRALIDFAEQSGLIGDKFRPAIDRMIAALDRLIERFDDFLGRLSSMSGIRLPDVPSRGGGETHQGGGSGGDYFGFNAGSGGLRDFGSGTLAMLHNREAVLTEGQYQAMKTTAGLSLSGSAPSRSSGPVVVQSPIYLDRWQVGVGVAEVWPSVTQAYGGRR